MICMKAKIGQGRSGIPLSWDTQGQLVSVATNGVFAEAYCWLATVAGDRVTRDR